MIGLHGASVQQVVGKEIEVHLEKLYKKKNMEENNVMVDSKDMKNVTIDHVQV